MSEVWVLVRLRLTTFCGCGTVRTVPSLKTKVIDATWPRTQDKVQSPAAVPLMTAPTTSGRSIPLAVRLSGPTSTLNG
ncbi:hypothetical protein D3C80_1322190 [compost metagenome]